jgi:hypothetical protein
MRRLVYVIVVCGLAGVASADSDAHAEMAAALAAQIDAHPAPVALPSTVAATRVAATPAAKHVPPQANLGRAAADHAQGQGQGPPASALAHQAQAAAASAAGQAQAAEAKARHKPHH